jgi:HD superfamily phosphohydrolase YqeK
MARRSGRKVRQVLVEERRSMVMLRSVLTDYDRTVLAELEALVKETYQLWDEIWVGFSWRNYTYDHVMRVRNLARTIAEREDGDLRSLEFGATLHDVTKSFDGEILMRDGKRVLDADGFWLNEKLPPTRRNRVVDLYDNLGLEGTVHHVSGGHIATALLRDYGYDGEFGELVREVIAAHLKPHPDSSTSGLSLYDADTIDANIGLPAFYRNIQITMHRMEQDYARRGESLTDYLAAELRPFLTSYLGERIPTWIQGKHTDFVAKLTTPAGRDVARARIDALSGEVAAMVDELGDFERNVERGRLAIVRRFIENRDNPSLAAEASLLDNWAASPTVSDVARTLVSDYRAEIAGQR